MMLDVNRSMGVQAQEQDPLLTVWNTENTSVGSSATKTIVLPLAATGTYDFWVDWGDGSRNRITAFGDAGKTHVYADAGVKTIRIYGKLLRGWSFAGTGDRLKLTEIKRWGRCFRFGSGAGISGFFQACANLTISATDKPTLDGVSTTMANAFNGCVAITSIPGLDSWNMSQITNMASMFQGATLFNQDIGSWNTANVTSMANMFQSAAAFNNGGSASINNWNTANVTSMANMFNAATAFNQNIGSWNTAKVTSTYRMFLNCPNFDQDLGSWDVSKVTGSNSMQEMFRGCTVFNNGGSASIDNWRPALAQNMSYMFRDARAFNQPIGSWTIGNVTSMVFTFNGARVFNQNIGAWDVSKVTTMANMFENAWAFNNGGSGTIDNWNTGAVTNMSLMFYNAYAFDQPIGSWNVANVTTMSAMFQEAWVFNRSLASWNTVKVTNMNSMFRGRVGIPLLFDQNIGSWNVTALPTGGGAGAMFVYSLLSVANYDALLVGWQAQAVQNGVIFSGGVSKYTKAPSAAATARAALIATNLWTITDGGPTP